MKLTASPFDPQSGELLPVYRDAYLRGDLSNASARAVEEYLRRDADQAHEVVTRWHHIQDQEAVAAPSWVNRQISYIKAEPQRFRRRAASLVTGAALVGGMVFAGTNQVGHSVSSLENSGMIATTAEFSSAAEANSMRGMRVVTVTGRIVDEDGEPLVGATVMRKGTRFGVSTDANGTYSLRVPAGQETLVFGYGGYNDEELQVKNASSSADVTLTPREKKRNRFFFF